MKISLGMLAGASFLALGCVSALAQQVTGVPGSPGATTTIDGKQLPPPEPNFGGVIKEKASESTLLVGAARRAAEGRAQCAAHHDRRCRLRCARYIWRGGPHTGARPYRRAGAALHQFPLHRALLADAGGHHHGTQPSLGGYGRGGRTGNGVSGLRHDHPDRQRHRRYNPEGKRVRHLVVRQEPQHPFVPIEPGRAVQSVAQRNGLRVFLWLRRRRREPVATQPVPQYDGDLSVPGQSRLEPDDRDGGRCHPAHEAAQGDRARQAVLCLLRARRHPRAASSDAGVDQEDRRHAPVR